MQSTEGRKLTFTRQEFYERIWSVPATQFAKEIGISDVMIGKVCMDHQIPKPYPGYWSKIRYGKKPKKAPLPEVDKPELETLVFGKPVEPEPEPTDDERKLAYDFDIQDLIDSALSLDRLVVTEQLRQPHSLINIAKHLRKEQKHAFLERTYRCHGDHVNALSIDVSPSQFSRALRIMDALIKRVEKIGGRVEVRTNQGYYDRTETVIVFGEEDVAQIRLREKCKQVNVPRDKRSDYTWRETKRVPTGMLLIDDGPGGFQPAYLNDTPTKRRIEDDLHDWVISLIYKAGDMRVERREEEEARRREQERERIRREREEDEKRRRKEFEKRQGEERRRVEELAANAESWQKSQKIRDYLKAAKQMVQKRDGAIPVEGAVADYFAWAEVQAERLDPLMPNPPSIMDETFTP